MTKTSIKHTVEFKTSASRIYEILTSSALFTSLVGAPAVIDAKVGGNISLFGGMITGKNLELINGKKVVQDWRVKAWPEGVTSQVTFNLSEKSGVTTLTLEHSGFPADAKDHLNEGWAKNYWEPITALISI